MASHGDKTRYDVPCSDHLEDHEIHHYGKRALEEQPFGPSTKFSE